MSLVLPAPGPPAQVSAACPERSRRVEGLVGPRPEDPRYVAHYTPEQRQVLAVRPGITSAASLAYRDDEQLLSNAARQCTTHGRPECTRDVRPMCTSDVQPSCTRLTAQLPHLRQSF